jgi:hypothetical protein
MNIEAYPGSRPRVIDSGALGNSGDCLRRSTYACPSGDDFLLIHHMPAMHYQKFDPLAL